MLMINHSMIS